MSLTHWRELTPGQVDPKRLALLLAQHGWSARGGQAGLYTRYVPEGDTDLNHRLIVPLDSQRADYDDLLREALAVLGSMSTEHGSSADKVLRNLIRVPGDEVRFRKFATTIQGAVSWPTGEDLVISSRNALLAAAKSQVTKRPYHGNLNGRFARRYLSSVLMGQTEVGSYVVVAYTPVDEIFHEKEPTQEGLVPSTVGVHRGREITQTLLHALEATQEAVEHYEKNNKSLAGFVRGVDQGLSKEFAEAIKGLVENAEGAEVGIRLLVEHLRAEQATEPEEEDVAFEFSSAITPVLDEAILRLATTTPSAKVTATGWVSVVERPNRGAPGIVRLKVITGSDATTLRVRLTKEQFEVATEAIKAEQLLTVSGRQEREGRTYWLYNVTDLTTIDVDSTRAGSESNRDQLGLFEDEDS